MVAERWFGGCFEGAPVGGITRRKKGVTGGMAARGGVASE